MHYGRSSDSLGDSRPAWGHKRFAERVEMCGGTDSYKRQDEGGYGVKWSYPLAEHVK